MIRLGKWMKAWGNMEIRSKKLLKEYKLILSIHNLFKVQDLDRWVELDRIWI